MSNRYNQGTHFSGATRFVQTPMAEVEFSKMVSPMRVLTDMNAGDIVPVLCLETLPHSTFSIDFNYVNRLLSALYVPVMGDLVFDVFAFHCPTRVVNRSWKNVLGENTSGFWSAPEVDLAPLCKYDLGSSIQIEPGSIADYYDLPTQAPIYKTVLSQMSDTIPRQYYEIYNTYFRDQNYQPAIPYSKLNIFQGFLEPSLTLGNISINPSNIITDGSADNGAIAESLFGERCRTEYPGSDVVSWNSRFSPPSGIRNFNGKPLKANKLHDAITSVLPAPQKGAEVVFSAAQSLPVDWSLGNISVFGSSTKGIEIASSSGIQGEGYSSLDFYHTNHGATGSILIGGAGADSNAPTTSLGALSGSVPKVVGWNVNGSVDIPGLSLNDLRNAIATQHVLELLARGGSRYWSFLKSFFGIEVDDPFPDIPTQIGHYRSTLDMYQVAQTSQSTEDSAQASLAAFGYSTNGSGLFTKTFIEHGFIHVFAVIRHKSIYPTFTPPHWFKRKTLDFYLPQFANISEQPIRTAILNPFDHDAMEKCVGFQEAFWDYRYDLDRVRGGLRSGIPGSLDVWHYGNKFDEAFTHVNGDWLVSDTQDILDRALRVPSAEADSPTGRIAQFICQFDFKITKQLPMPVYSIPGLDTI